MPVVDSNRPSISPKAKPPRDFLSRQEQRKLFFLVMSIGLVILAINEARKPETWQWLLGADPEIEQGEPWPRGLTTRTNRLGADPEIEQGEPAPYYSDYDTEYVPELLDEPDPSEVRILPRDPTMVDQSRPYFPGVEPHLLREVRDHMPHRSAEAPAWFHLLAVLRDNPAEILERASSGEVTFVQLYEQPDSYRGELVTLRGRARAATQDQATPNTQGFEKYYQVVLQLPDGPQRPIVTKVLELPEGFPRGQKIDQEVVMTGFFYKNWVYTAVDGKDYIAPMVLAKTLQWVPEAGAESLLPSVAAVLGSVAVLAAVAIGFSLIVYYRSKRLQLPQAYLSTIQPAPGSLEALSKQPVKTVGEQLQELAEHQRSEAGTARNEGSS